MKILELKRDAEQFRHIYSRSEPLSLRAKPDNNEFVFRNILATENPAIVWDWYNWEPIREILIMKGAVLPESRQLIFLNNHSRYDISDILGSTRGIEITADNVMEGDTHISSVAERERTLAKEGHLTDTSIGYKTFSDQTVQLAPGEKTMIEGREYCNNYPDGLPLVIRLSWQPFENSGTPIGADQAAKFRSMFGNQSSQKPEEQIEEIARTHNINIEFTKTNQPSKQERKMGDEVKTPEQIQADIDAGAQQRADAEIDRREAIRAIPDSEYFQNKLPKDLDLRKETEPFIQNKERTAKDFKLHLYSKIEETEASRTMDTNVGLSDKEIERYQVHKVVRALAGGGGIETTEIQEALEASRTLAKKLGMDSQQLGARTFLIPGEIVNKRTSVRHLTPEFQRDLSISVGSDTQGGYTVDTEMSFIEKLVKILPLVNAGVNFRTGLKGKLSMVRDLGEATHHWCEEGFGPNPSSFLWAKEGVTGMKGAALASGISYEWLNQTELNAEAYVEEKLIKACRKGIFLTLLEGLGVGEPKGLLNTSGTGSISGTDFNRGVALQMAQNLMGYDNLRGEPKWVSTFALRELLKDVKIDAGSGLFLVNDNNKMVGYDYSNCSDLISDSNLLILGIWAYLHILMWDAIGVAVNPFGAGFPSGDIDVRAIHFTNFFNEQPAAFVISEDVVPAAAV